MFATVTFALSALNQQVALASGTIAEGGALDSGAVSAVTGNVPAGVAAVAAVVTPVVSPGRGLVVVWGSVDVVVVSSNFWSGAWASGATPRKMSRIACMLAESLCQIRTSAPPTFLPVASIWYVGMLAVSTSLTTPTNWIILSMVSGRSTRTSSRYEAYRAAIVFGRSKLLLSAAVRVRRRKSCCRAMRPRSDDGSSWYLPLASLYFKWRERTYFSAS